MYMLRWKPCAWKKELSSQRGGMLKVFCEGTPRSYVLFKENSPKAVILGGITTVDSRKRVKLRGTASVSSLELQDPWHTKILVNSKKVNFRVDNTTVSRWLCPKQCQEWVSKVVQRTWKAEIKMQNHDGGPCKAIFYCNSSSIAAANETESGGRTETYGGGRRHTPRQKSDWVMRTHCGGAQVKWQSQNLCRSHKTQQECSMWELPPSLYWSTSCTTLRCQSAQQAWLQQWILSNPTVWEVSRTDCIHHAIQAILFQNDFLLESVLGLKSFTGKWLIPCPECQESLSTLMTSSSAEEVSKNTTKRLRSALERMQEAGVTLNENCIFSVDTIKFLGHIISQEGIKVDPAKVEAITNLLRPINIQELRWQEWWTTLAVSHQIWLTPPSLSMISSRKRTHGPGPLDKTQHFKHSRNSWVPRQCWHTTVLKRKQRCLPMHHHMD